MTSSSPTLRRAAGLLATLAVGLLVGGCGGNADSTADGPTGRPSASAHGDVAEPLQATWPVPRSARDLLAAMERMPRSLGDWDQAEPVRGAVRYEHRSGQLGIEAAELADLFGSRMSAAEAVERTGADLDPGTVSSCSRPPYRCVLGEYQGRSVRVWGHDRSPVLLTAFWPETEARDLLADAWVGAQDQRARSFRQAPGLRAPTAMVTP